MKKTILISGGSGMIGHAVAEYLVEQGYGIRILTRKKNKLLLWDQYEWNPDKSFIEDGALDQVYGVLQLSGESIAAKRWSPERKKVLTESRISATRVLIEHINALQKKPQIFISTSAIGIYGHRPKEILTEQSTTEDQGFLSHLCIEWESTLALLDPLVRQAIVRVGLVLSLKNGILAQSLWPAHWGIAPILGRGTQMYSWIHIQDLARIYHHIIKHNSSSGVYNGTAPQPVQQKQFTKSICKALHNPSIPLPAPRVMLRIVLGEFADSLFDSQEVTPTKALEEGFQFKYPTLKGALTNLIDRATP